MNPFLDREPAVSLRDPAAFWHNGTWYCFHTAVERTETDYHAFVDVTTSADLTRWAMPRRLADSPLNFSSPGNVLRVGDKWLLCVQSYPIARGQLYGDETSRLWLMESRDFDSWSHPLMLHAAGCQATWASSQRQIDPYLVEHDGQFWCFYKTNGQLGLMVSPDLQTWREATQDRPALGSADTPDGATVENPCVVRDGERFVLFFAPCRAGRGIGVAESDDLLHWRNVHYLDFPGLPWAPGGPTAAMVLDTRQQRGCWTMFFHGDRERPHGAALGLVYSDDLEHWHE